MASALELPQNKVRIICTEVGGGFGGKNYLRIEPLVVALASHANGRPVKVAFTRDEEFIASVCKHPVHLTFRTGVRRDGTIVARKIEAVFDTGGYADTGPLVARNGAFSGTGPYRIPHVCVDSYCVYTNNPLGGSFRGFGVPQLTWAHESQMDMIAARLGIDPVEIRMRNLYNLGDKTCTGEVLRTSVGVKDSLRMAVDLSERRMRHGRSDNPKVAHGRGIATMHKLTNTPSTSSVIVKMHTDGTVNVLCSTVELGQGIYTALRQIVAEFHKDIHEFTEDSRISPDIFDLMLLESPIHSADIITHMADSPVASTAAIVKRTRSGHRDVHAALIEFENEVVCQFTAAYTAGGRLERYELHGDYVSVYLEGVQQGWVLREGERTELAASYESAIDTVAQARHFVQSITDDIDFPPPAATLESSIATLRLCESILESVDDA